LISEFTLGLQFWNSNAISTRRQLVRNIAANPPASRKFLGGWLKRNNVLRKLVGEPETKTQII